MPTLFLPSLLATILCLASTTAGASLGGAPSDFGNAGAVQARQLRAVGAGAAGAASYSVNETTLDGGTLVREYVGAGGTVFAVSWNGPFLPDLRTLLGQQFATLNAENAARIKRGQGRGQLRVERSEVVIESGGHMRAWAGRAWLVGALPAGFDTGVIQ